jgi:hypothetical protein
MNDNQVTIDLEAFRPEYQHLPQSFEVGGVSFPPFHLLKRTAVVTGVAMLGTIPLPATDYLDLAADGIEVVFAFPSSSDLTAEDDYSRIREEIVASGLPMLSDEEVRTEIRDRKGSRGIIES